MNVKNPDQFVSGILLIVVGVISLYFGYDFENTNLDTFVNDKLIAAALLYLGFFLTGIGLLSLLVSFVKPKNT